MNTALVSFLPNDIAIQTLSSWLKKNGYNCTCIFCTEKFNVRNLKAIAELFAKEEISLVGISILTDNYDQAVILTKSIKEKYGIPVIWGGAHVNAMPEESLRYADMICMGEGEGPLLDLVKDMSGAKSPDMGIRNIWFQTKNGIVRNELRDLEENLDKYQYHDYDVDTQYLLTKEGCVGWKEKFMQKEYHVMASRGCPYNCAYCYNNYRRKQYAGKGRYLRERTVENVIQELTQAKSRYAGLERVYFVDDDFTSRRIDDIKKFKELYRSRIGIPFYAHADPRTFNEEKIGMLKESGLNRLQVGIQSGSNRLNEKVYNRKISNEKIIEIARYLHRLGIKGVYDIIFNNPYETPDDITETIKLLLKLPRPFSIEGYNLIFYPGTDITGKALKDGLIYRKPDEYDISTIQGGYNSPLNIGGKNIFSTRFYEIRFNPDEKKYWNQILFLFNLRWFSLIKFFASSYTFYKRIMLDRMITIYLIYRKIKYRLKFS